MYRIVIEETLENAKPFTLLSFSKWQKPSKEYGMKAFYINLEHRFVFITIQFLFSLFRVKHEDPYSDLNVITAGSYKEVSWVQSFMVYDFPTTFYTTSATFANETVIMAEENPLETIWTKQYQIKHNESKSAHIDVTNKNQPMLINGTQLFHANAAKYL